MQSKTDGRDINLAIAELTGEGAAQRVTEGVERVEASPAISDSVPATYYGRPLLKAPVWKMTVPLYYFVGGAAGASLAIGAAAQVEGSLEGLVRRCRRIGLAGCALSGALLIDDLGRPSRFHHMLRVFRPTSPMNMGVWILAAASKSAGLAVFFRRGALKWMGDAGGIGAGLTGLALATYTGVLVSTTAVPVWQESRRILPILFGASALASAGSILDLTFDAREAGARRVVYSIGNLGRAAELAASVALERAVSRAGERVARPLRSGGSGFLWKSAAALTAASLAVSLWPGQSRGKRRVAGALGIAGSLMLRYGIHAAGVESSRDARASFEVQR
jgi:formate-dependent nitrite reductase membrane component NrfD